MPKTAAVVLLSGGQDSTTCLFHAKKTWDEVHAVTFRYGQRHASEIEAARQIADLADVASWKVLDVEALAQVGGSSLVDDGEIRASGGMADAEAPDGLPTTFVPARNAVFLALAAGHAARVGAGHVVIGVSEADYSGYPDCREPFVEAMEKALRHAMPSSVGGIAVQAPLMGRDKRATVLLARELGDECWEALGLSVTCYEGRRPGCGRCPACELRAAGFRAAGLEDPATTAAPTRRLPAVGDWVWSADGEGYGEAFSTREEAVEDATRELGGDAFYVARVRELADGVAAVKSALDVDWLRDAAQDWMYENYGCEDGDDRWRPDDDSVWPDLEQRLATATEEWGRRHGLRVSWYTVGDAEAVSPDQLSLDVE